MKKSLLILPAVGILFVFCSCGTILPNNPNVKEHRVKKAEMALSLAAEQFKKDFDARQHVSSNCTFSNYTKDYSDKNVAYITMTLSRPNGKDSIRENYGMTLYMRKGPHRKLDDRHRAFCRVDIYPLDYLTKECLEWYGNTGNATESVMKGIRKASRKLTPAASHVYLWGDAWELKKEAPVEYFRAGTLWRKAPLPIIVRNSNDYRGKKGTWNFLWDTSCNCDKWILNTFGYASLLIGLLLFAAAVYVFRVLQRAAIEHWSITYADDTSQVANICNSIMLILTFLGAVLVSGVTYYDPEPDLTHDISFRLGFIVLCVGLAAMLVATISAIIAHHRRAWSHALLFILILFGCFFTAVFWSHFVFLFRLILYAVAGLLILVLIGHRDVLSWSNAPLDESGHKIPGEFDSNDPNVFNTNDGRRLVRNTNHGEWEEN